MKAFLRSAEMHFPEFLLLAFCICVISDCTDEKNAKSTLLQLAWELWISLRFSMPMSLILYFWWLNWWDGESALEFWRFLTFPLSFSISHTCTFLFQRVNQCLRNACHFSGIESCVAFIDCEHGNAQSHHRQVDLENWKRNQNATDCFISEDGPFDYGVYHRAVNLVAQQTFAKRYVYSLFWGFQVPLVFKIVSTHSIVCLPHGFLLDHESERKT